MERKPVDIVIPIYNAYDDLKLCIESLERYTDLTKDRIICIDDNSLDKRVRPFLESLATLTPGVKVVYNSENRGFSNNVNIGMKSSIDRDVILLNSDTIVTAHWVDKMQRCAYSKSEIATVTPLSNSATLCSIPNMCQDNELPEGMTVDQVAEVVEHCSMHKYPRITVAVGFCMYVKREVIENIGYFDAETFQRGYGEENDFCNRAEQCGYIHVMCDDTFIYHKGTVSFVSEEKQDLIEEHDKILNERYPMQMQKNHLYCINNPDQYIRDNINLYLELANCKKNILYLVHSDFREDALDHVGGTQMHVKDLTINLRKDHNVFVMARDGQYLRLTIYTETAEHCLKFDIGEVPDFPEIRNDLQYRIYQNVLKAFQIDVVHIHHTHDLTFDLFYAAHELDIPIVVTIHDFYYVCPKIKLLNCDYKYCNGIENQQMCTNCMREELKIAGTVNYINYWRKQSERVLQFCESIITPSESAKDILVQYYPVLRKKITVISHGTDMEPECKALQEKKIKESAKVHINIDYKFDNPQAPFAIIGWAYCEEEDSSTANIYLELYRNGRSIGLFKTTKVRRDDVAGMFGNEKYNMCGFWLNATVEVDKFRIVIEHDGVYETDGTVVELRKTGLLDRIREHQKLHVAFLGGLNPAKGSLVAYNLITNSKDDIQWFTIGSVGDERLANLKQDNVLHLGAYNKNELLGMLLGYHIDVICILSVWPETFCYTLSEAILCGIPVIGMNMGAVGERIGKNGYGWTVDVNSKPEDILKLVYKIKKNKIEYAKVRNKAQNYKEKDVRTMIEEYREFYSQFPKKEKSELVFEAESVFRALI